PALPPPPIPTLFPYTTLFRSVAQHSEPRPLHRWDGYARRCRLPVICRDRRESGASSLSARRAARGGGPGQGPLDIEPQARQREPDRKSTRLNSSHLVISYAVF